MAARDVPHIQCATRSELPFHNVSDIQAGDGLVVRRMRGKGRFRHHVRCVGKSFQLSRAGSSMEYEKSEALKEAKLLRRARHQHVIDITATYLIEPSQGETPWFGFIMEEAKENLKPYLDGTRPCQKSWYGCLVNVLCHIHSIGIQHRDIKPENILIQLHQGERVVVLADFGISQMGLGNTLSTTIPALARGRTKEYCAPEVEHGSTRGRAADIFSLGAVFLEMLVATCCIEKRRGLLGIVRDNSPPNYAGNLEAVHGWMENELKPGLESDWQRQIFALCRTMLRRRRDEKPQAQTLVDTFSSSEALEDCKCANREELCEEEKLVEACKNGDQKLVKRLLDGVADAKAEGAIHQAAVRDDIDIVKLLLARSPSAAGATDYSRRTALHCAAGYGHYRIAKLVIENGGDSVKINLQDQGGQTALHRAAANGHGSFSKLLLENGANPSLRDHDECTALHFAARRGHSHIIELLLQEPDVDARRHDKRRRTPLHFAAGCGSLETLKSLLAAIDRSQRGTEAFRKDSDARTPLHFAASGQTGSADYGAVTRVLLQQEGVNRNVRNFQNRQEQTPLHQAAENGSYQVVEALLDTTLVKSGCQEEANLAAFDTSGYTPLHYAAMRKWTWPDGDYPKVTKLLVQKLDAEALMRQDNDGRTALHLAADIGAQDIVRTLLSCENISIDCVDCVDSDGETALHLASRGKQTVGQYVDVIRALKERGADVKKQNRYGSTALDRARSNGYEDRVAALSYSG